MLLLSRYSIRSLSVRKVFNSIECLTRIHSSKNYLRRVLRTWFLDVSRVIMRQSLPMARQAVEKRIQWEQEVLSAFHLSRSVLYLESLTLFSLKLRTGKNSQTSISTVLKSNSLKFMEMTCTTCLMSESLTKSQARAIRI